MGVEHTLMSSYIQHYSRYNAYLDVVSLNVVEASLSDMEALVKNSTRDLDRYHI